MARYPEILLSVYEYARAATWEILTDRDLRVALAGNAEAVEDCPRRVGAVEGVEVNCGNVMSVALPNFHNRVWQRLPHSPGAGLDRNRTRLSTFSDVHPPLLLKFDAS